MNTQINLTNKLENLLSPEALELLDKAAKIAGGLGYRIFLVGGAVRDILLGRAGFDLDLSVEGDAIEMAKALALKTEQVTVHHRFNTARLQLKGYHLDLARSREETYARPGALPTVCPGTIEADLKRRDFTINAMAISLNAADSGQLIDVCQGQEDLKAGIIRILHPDSFVDDATRLWRAVRYEERLGFNLEPKTLRLFKRDLKMITSITPDRQRYELECVLGEPEPDRAFLRADELGLLRLWHPALRGDDWLVEAFRKARASDETPSPNLYLSLLCWRMTQSQKNGFAKTLRLTRRQHRMLTDSAIIVESLPLLNSLQTPPSLVSALLADLDPETLSAALAAPLPERAQHNIRQFRSVWRQITAELTGNDLQVMGIPRGPEIKRLLEEIRNQRLDGRISGRAEEETFVRSWVERFA
ncbi:MAG: CCA tRNA nucleotidyltransferase [Dehalogenimonas sp.]